MSGQAVGATASWVGGAREGGWRDAPQQLPGGSELPELPGGRAGGRASLPKAGREAEGSSTLGLCPCAVAARLGPGKPEAQGPGLWLLQKPSEGRTHRARLWSAGAWKVGEDPRQPTLLHCDSKEKGLNRLGKLDTQF